MLTACSQSRWRIFTQALNGTTCSDGPCTRHERECSALRDTCRRAAAAKGPWTQQLNRNCFMTPAMWWYTKLATCSALLTAPITNARWTDSTGPLSRTRWNDTFVPFVSENYNLSSILMSRLATRSFWMCVRSLALRRERCFIKKWSRCDVYKISDKYFRFQVYYIPIHFS